MLLSREVGHQMVRVSEEWKIGEESDMETSQAINSHVGRSIGS
jgi:hypothetical protein